jgi:hypothetical protein
MNILPLPNGDFTTEEWVTNNGPLTVTVHKIRMGDVEDPDLLVAEPIYQWQQTEMGAWVMDNAVQKPMWQRAINDSYGWTYSIIAELSPKNYTYWWIKWGHELDSKRKL